MSEEPVEEVVEEVAEEAPKAGRINVLDARDMLREKLPNAKQITRGDLGPFVFEQDGNVLVVSNADWRMHQHSAEAFEKFVDEKIKGLGGE